ncbi:MAG: hypothetical protein Q4B17_04265 [Lautropia sp.]|nr:hypothetical protein [Lautropia sp.]
MMHFRRAVTLVSGASAEARSSCIQQMLAAAPEAGHSIWLRTGELPSVPDVPVSDLATGLQPATFLPPRFPGAAGLVPDQVMAGGCICCLAGPVFRTTLVRLLRQSGWQHLILELPQQDPAHLLKVIDQLRSPPFDQYLRLADVVAVLDAPDTGRSAWASACLSRQGPGSLGGRFAARDFPAAQASGWLWHYRDPLAGWAPAASTSSAMQTILFQRWPADGDRPSRREVQQALESVLATPGVLSLHAVLQSHRSAYEWWGPGEGPSPEPASGGSGFDPDSQNLSAVLRSRETVWRLDNRIRLGLAQGTDLALLGAELTRLKAH